MNKNQKIDINGSIEDSVVGVFQHGCGMVVVGLLFGFMFAPMIAPLFELVIDDMADKKYGEHHYHEKAVYYFAMMKKVKAVLWGIAILTWVAVLVCYYTHQAF